MIVDIYLKSGNSMRLKLDKPLCINDIQDNCSHIKDLSGNSIYILVSQIEAIYNYNPEELK